MQRCCVHKLRNLVRKAPKHGHDEIADDFHRIVYAAGESAAREAYSAFAGKWKSRCPGVARSLANLWLECPFAHRHAGPQEKAAMAGRDDVIALQKRVE